MLKMKFFTKDQPKESVVKKAENKKTETALRQPTRTSRLAPPTKVVVEFSTELPLRASGVFEIFLSIESGAK